VWAGHGANVFAAQFVHALGATVILTSSSYDKLQIGSRLGATHLINYRTTPDWETEVRRLTDGRGADLVVDVGGAETLGRSVRAARMAGTVTVTGVLTGFDSAPVPIAQVLFNSIRLIGVTVGSVRSFNRTVRNDLPDRDQTERQPHVRVDRAHRGGARLKRRRTHRQDRTGHPMTAQPDVPIILLGKQIDHNSEDGRHRHGGRHNPRPHRREGTRLK
jgi:NADPH:quinone reductase-like Zn-dependent oxidoreductase